MRLTQKIFFIAAITAFLISCGTPTPKGYNKISDGFYYKLLSFDESKRLPMKGDYLSLSVDMLTEKDVLIFSTSTQRIDGRILHRAGIQNSIPPLLSCLDDGLLLMHEGDSVSFIMNTDTAFRRIESWILKLARQDILKFNVKLHKIQNEAAYVKDVTEKKKLLEDGDILEKIVLQKYLKEKNITAEAIANGFYFLEEKKGDGDKVALGKYITVQYKASYLNGKIFHSTYDDVPFEFTFGEQGQVIKGMEIGLVKMRQGGKAKFIIPSHLAFGEKGSSTGQVPPYTTVIYEVEVIKVK